MFISFLCHYFSHFLPISYKIDLKSCKYPSLYTCICIYVCMNPYSIMFINYCKISRYMSNNYIEFNYIMGRNSPPPPQFVFGSVLSLRSGPVIFHTSEFITILKHIFSTVCSPCNRYYTNLCTGCGRGFKNKIKIKATFIGEVRGLQFYCRIYTFPWDV